MLAYLTGTVQANTKDGAIIKVGDLGYEVTGSWLKLISPGAVIETWTYQYLENDSIPRLIGCRGLEERSLFMSLLSVSGVGPKMAGRIVETAEPAKLINSITTGDISLLSSVKGLGKKTAQKIILELGKILLSSGPSADDSLVEALSGLKFTPAEIRTAISVTDLAGLSEKDKLTALLKVLGASS